jgi:importin subunit beta-1
MELSNLLSEALSPDQQTRNQAEVNIDMIATQNFGLFLLNLSKELCDESNFKGIRQIASTIIKNMVSFTPKYKGQWELLSRDVKSQIKQNVLSTLASSEKEIRKAAGIAVAGICKIELPLGVLCLTSQNENNYIQLASVLTLGYITQEITTRDLNDDDVCQILSAYYQILNFSTNTELQAQTIVSLLNFIPFTKRIFENKVSLMIVM